RVAGGVQSRHRGAHRHRLSGPDVTHDDPQGGLHDAKADAGHGLLVGDAGVKVLGGDRLGERGAGKPEVRHPRGPAHRAPSAPSLPSVPWPASSVPRPDNGIWENEIGPTTSASWAAATKPR